MRSLFLKIFIWFWVASAAVTLAHFTASWLLEPDFRERFLLSRLAIIATRAGDKFEHGGRSEADDYLTSVEGATLLKFYLFDAEGRQVAGQTAPAQAKQLSTAPQAQHRGIKPLVLPEFMAKTAGTQSGAKYTLVAGLWRGFGRRIPFLDFPIRWTELLTGLIAGGILCYGLARYLSAPVVKLRRATRQLAGGDLKTRVGVSLGKRRDELADLGRDFDVMAERIESLMMTERRLLHDISHELRSPLARLGVALELARQGESDEVKWALDRIEIEADRLNGMVGQILTLARLENGAREAASHNVDLCDLIHQIAVDADFEARSRNRSVKVIAADECEIEGSPDLLRSAIENVVRNSIVYTREGTEVEVELRRRNEGGQDFAIISVRDYGQGVPEAALAEIFRPFYRVADARDRETGGSGLGLSITRRAVGLHGGSVSAANVPAGGLKVEIRLPVRSSARQQEAAAPAPAVLSSIPT